MAEFDILSTQFPTGSEPSELHVVIDNPQTLNLYIDPGHTVPEDVEQVAPGEKPTQELWVYRDNYHLTIILGDEGGANPIVVGGTNYFNAGEAEKYLDIVVASQEDGITMVQNIRRRDRKVFK